MLLFGLGAKAQIGITAFGGAALYSATSAPADFDDNYDLEGKGGYQFGLELTKGFASIAHAGVGFMAHRPSISGVSLDTMLIDNEATSIHFGSPALTFYGTVGLHRSIMNVELSGGVALGYTLLSGEESITATELNTAEGGGFYAGLNLGAAYNIAGPLYLGLRTGVQYYGLNIDNLVWDGSTSLLAIPIALTIGVKF